MAKDERRFVIVPREILTAPRYAKVKADRCALGSWLILFLEADALWPVAPGLPRWLGDAELELLTDSGLLTVIDDGERYRLAIVDATRSAAKSKAESGAAARWGKQPDAPSIAPSNAPGIAHSNATSIGQEDRDGPDYERNDAPSNAPSNAWGDAQPMPTQTETQTETNNGMVGRVGRPARRSPTKRTGFTRAIERP